MIETSSFVAYWMMIVIGLVVPIGIAIWWVKVKHESFMTVMIGAGTWFVFASVLENIPKVFLFTPASPIGEMILNNPVLFTVTGALLAGIFEETGRFIVFKTLLKKNNNKETGISHGIGHGGIETIFILAVSGFSNLMTASMINAGGFQDLLDQTRASGIDTTALEALPAQLSMVTPVSAGLACSERISAMLLHMALSMLVFYAVKKSKIVWYVVAVFVHALLDVPAALYQYGVIDNVFITEGIIAVYGIGFFVLIIMFFYKRFDEDGTSASNNVSGQGYKGME